MSAEIDGTSKGLLGAFATLTLGSGLASLGYGILLLYRYLGVEHNYGDFNLFITSILLIAVGGLLIITLLLGVMGALKDISNLRVVTLVLLFLLFVVLAVVGAYGMVLTKTTRLGTSIEKDIEYLKTNYKDALPDVKKKADYLYKHYNCCTTYSESNPRENEEAIPKCVSNINDENYVKQDCAKVYSATKSYAVFCVAILALIAAGLVLLALVLYAALSQRARAGYAVVSRGQLK